MSPPKGRRRRKRALFSRYRRWWLLGGVLTLGVLLWLGWPFWQLSGQFGAVPAKQPSRLYGRSELVEVSQALSAKNLARKLERLGYRQSQGTSAPGSFLVTGDRLEVSQRKFPTLGGMGGGALLTVRFSGGRIRELTLGGRQVDKAALDAPLVASYYGPELRDRRPVTLDELPEDLILAVLAAEDAKFLKHTGVSILGMIRAAWVNFRTGTLEQGGSTLTQQLVKNIYLTHDRTVLRKVQDILLAVLLELRYDKRSILQAYLNEIFWGRSGVVNIMGIGTASWAYFGKPPSELTLAESALLAGIIPSPVNYSPVKHPQRARERRAFVLARLADLQWIEPQRLQAATNEPIQVLSRPLKARAMPYFADAMAAEAERRFGISELRDGGYTLLSTLDHHAQERAEEAISWGVEALEEGWEKGRKRKGPLQASLISVAPESGSIRAYVGGRDYGLSQFDRVSHARRQAGSAFKPIVFAAAYAGRVASPTTYLADEPLTVQLAGQRWSPQNSNGEYNGMVSTRTALERSLNVPTARLAIDVGLKPISALARSMGLGGDLAPYPALALGAAEVTPRELVTAYAVLANGGQRPPIHGLRAVLDAQHERVAGQALPEPQRVLSREVSFLVSWVLQGVLDRGTGSDVRRQGLTDAMAGKTGTTNSRRDSWFAGHSPDSATLVWVGYDDNSTTRLSGTRAALPIWTRFTHAVRPPGGYSPFIPPEGVVSELIDPTTGALATDECPERRLEYFLADFTPTAFCPQHGSWLDRHRQSPEGVEPGGRRHPFRRWLDKIRGRRDGRRG